MEKLCVSLEGDGSLYFHPTAVGSRTQRSHHIRNLSRLPLRLVGIEVVIPALHFWHFSKYCLSGFITQSSVFSTAGFLWLSFMIDSSGTFQSQTRSLSLLNQTLVNCTPMRAPWETSRIIHTFKETVQQIDNNKMYLPFFLFWCYRSKYGPSAHWQKEHTHSNPLSPSGRSRHLDVTSHSLPLKWWGWDLKPS